MAGKKKDQDFTIHKMQTCPEGKVLYLVLEVNLMVPRRGKCICVVSTLHKRNLRRKSHLLLFKQSWLLKEVELGWFAACRKLVFCLFCSLQIFNKTRLPRLLKKTILFKTMGYRAMAGHGFILRSHHCRKGKGQEGGRSVQSLCWRPV